ncbi:MAG: hypothetical protein R2703_14630 [Micropruina glycogenica]
MNTNTVMGTETQKISAIWSARPARTAEITSIGSEVITELSSTEPALIVPCGMVAANCGGR